MTRRTKLPGLSLVVLCVLMLGVVCACSSSTNTNGDGSSVADNPGDSANEAIRILCYGDSNTWGYVPGSVNVQYPEEQLWTTVLGQELGEGYQVIPAGRNGRTTAFDRDGSDEKNGLAHLPETLKSQQPVDILVIMLGTNDCTAGLDLSPEEIAQGLEKLVVKAQKCCRRYQGFVPQIVIVAPAAILPEYQGTIFDFQLDDSSVQKSHELAPLFQQVAQEHDCLFLDVTDAVEVSPADCLHLTVEGHVQLANLLAELIESL